jgi:hypothetical protein
LLQARQGVGLLHRVRELSTQLTNEASLDFTINNDVAISISKRAQREEETLGREQEIGTHLEGHECSWNHPATKERATALGRLYRLRNMN